jgi:hypothetical protein
MMSEKKAEGGDGEVVGGHYATAGLPGKQSKHLQARRRAASPSAVLTTNTTGTTIKKTFARLAQMLPKSTKLKAATAVATRIRNIVTR